MILGVGLLSPTVPRLVFFLLYII